jgi:hypothetical protein
VAQGCVRGDAQGHQGGALLQEGECATSPPPLPTHGGRTTCGEATLRSDALSTDPPRWRRGILQEEGSHLVDGKGGPEGKLNVFVEQTLAGLSE